MSQHCPSCGRFMKLVPDLTWEIDRYVPDKKWLCVTCDAPDVRGIWLA